MLKFHEGVRQGDSSAAQEFATAFDHSIREWLHSNYSLIDKTMFTTKDPWLGKPVCLNSVLFADDLLKMVVPLQENGPLDLLESVVHQLRIFLHTIKMDHNDDKLQALLTNTHNKNNRHWHSVHINKRKRPLMKSFCTKAKHLGCLISAFLLDPDHGSKVEITKRINDANHAWRCYWHFWTKSNVPLKVRVHVYRSTCFAILTQGLSSSVVSKTQEARLETWHMSKLRLFLLGQARGMSNFEVRRICNISSVHCRLLKARIRFWQKLIRRPLKHTAVLAALAGHLAFDKPQLRGLTPDPHANPWLNQMWQDLQCLATIDRSIAFDLERFGWKNLPLSESIKKINLKRLPKFSSPCDTGNRQPHTDYYRCACGQICKGPQGLAMHRLHIHKIQPTYYRFILGNECPCCRRVFSNKRQARVRVLKQTRPCTILPFNQRNPHLFAPARPSFRCPDCNLVCSCHNELFEHLAQHIRSLRWS